MYLCFGFSTSHSRSYNKIFNKFIRLKTISPSVSSNDPSESNSTTWDAAWNQLGNQHQITDKKFKHYIKRIVANYKPLKILNHSSMHSPFITPITSTNQSLFKPSTVLTSYMYKEQKNRVWLYQNKKWRSKEEWQYQPLRNL
jgi:hypothetical protein